MKENFGLYKIICEIGRGGMGVIYKAEDPRLNRLVAIKQLILDSVEPEKRDEFRERFRREAIVAAGLSHPNLVSIYDVSISPENSYYVMELLDGKSLRAHLESRPKQRMSAEEFLPILKQTCEALSHAHDMALVHRDVKPDNIFVLPDGKVKITDFGIARSSEPDNPNLTKPGVMLGTLSYVSPEQLQDARFVDHRADIYSLGVVTYEVLTGQLPFTGDGLTSTLMAIISKEAKPANEVCEEVTLDMASVIAKAMRKRSAERYSSLVEFQKEYEKALARMVQPNPGGNLLRPGLTGNYPSPSFKPGIALAPGTTGQTKLTPSQHIRSANPAAPGSAKPAAPGSFNGSASGSEETPKAVVKPWLSGRKNEIKKETEEGKMRAITQSMPLVKLVGQIGRHGEGPGFLQEPVAIAARSGKVVVADAIRRDFQIFSRDGQLISETRTNPNAKSSRTAGGTFTKPSALAMDSQGKIYAADQLDHYVRVFDSRGFFLNELHNKSGKDGGISGLFCDGSAYIYISDPDNGCVNVLSTLQGSFLRKIGEKGKGDGYLQLPQSICVDRFGTTYVLDYGSSKIVVFDKSGIFQRSWGGRGTGKGEFNVPRGLAVDKAQRIFVADSLNHRVCIFSSGGDYLYSFGGRGSEPGRFIGPSDLCIDPDSNLVFVVDKGNSRVQIFEMLS